jgi:hypothetical protein
MHKLEFLEITFVVIQIRGVYAVSQVDLAKHAVNQSFSVSGRQTDKQAAKDVSLVR